MTLPSVVSRNNFLGNGATNIFSFTYRILLETDLLVTVRDLAGVETTLVLTTDYTVTGVGSISGGNVTLVDAGQSYLTGGFLTTNFVISLRRTVPNTQLLDLKNQGPYLPEDVENTFDRLVMQIQQLQDETDRSLRLSETTDPSVVSAVLPPPIAGQFFRWNSGATAIEGASIGDGATIVLPGVNGFGAFTTPATFSARTLTGSSSVGITNGNGVGGNPVFTVPNLGIVRAMLALLAVDTPQLEALAVTRAKLALLAVDTAQLEALAVTRAKIALLAIDTAQLEALAVTQVKLALLSVGTPQLIDASVTAAKLAAGAAGGSRIVDSAQNVSVGNTTSVVDLINHTFAAGSLVAGDQIRIRSVGHVRGSNATSFFNRIVVGGVVARDIQTTPRAGNAFGVVVVETTIHVRSNTQIVVREHEILYNFDFSSTLTTILSEKEGVNEVTVADISSNTTEVRQDFRWFSLPGQDPSLELRNITMEHVNA